MALLIQFLLRLTFGLALGMAITSSKRVTSGYFRNHLYVTLGLTSLAAVLGRTAAPEVFWYAVAAAVASYIGAVGWLYEKPGFGKVMLMLVALTAMGGGLVQLVAESENTSEVATAEVQTTATEVTPEPPNVASPLVANTNLFTPFTFITSGLLLGMTMASMLLGHWYLNTPTMEMAPLRRLIVVMAWAVGLQAIVSSLGLWGELAYAESFSTQWIAFISLRWTFGLIGVAILTWMAWQTLKIPNTQSATGILYVAVIGTFVGETMALLLSTESLFPL